MKSITILNNKFATGRWYFKSIKHESDSGDIVTYSYVVRRPDGSWYANLTDPGDAQQVVDAFNNDPLI